MNKLSSIAKMGKKIFGIFQMTYISFDVQEQHERSKESMLQKLQKTVYRKKYTILLYELLQILYKCIKSRYDSIFRK